MKKTLYALLLLPALSKVKTGKGGPAKMSSEGAQFLGSLCPEHESAAQKTSQDVSPSVS